MIGLFNKLQQSKQDTKTVEEFYNEMELTMMRANIQESEKQTIAQYFNGPNYPIKRIVEFQAYTTIVELVYQASTAERPLNEDIKYVQQDQSLLCLKAHLKHFSNKCEAFPFFNTIEATHHPNSNEATRNFNRIFQSIYGD
ncbi:hypothetical protein QYE76_050888 [Lolium multiflorum]|uniref:Uncharacterized protein n=1 Tax=Lolium multiflorum TaxID=4521 RepID=A0AAD8SS52_LOLMU|nr:hypothetical protein QYE76_050888 [Lolium multiflorum]